MQRDSGDSRERGKDFSRLCWISDLSPVYRVRCTRGARARARTYAATPNEWQVEGFKSRSSSSSRLAFLERRWRRSSRSSKRRATLAEGPHLTSRVDRDGRFGALAPFRERITIGHRVRDCRRKVEAFSVQGSSAGSIAVGLSLPRIGLGDFRRNREHARAMLAIASRASDGRRSLSLLFSVPRPGTTAGAPLGDLAFFGRTRANVNCALLLATTGRGWNSASSKPRSALLPRARLRKRTRERYVCRRVMTDLVTHTHASALVLATDTDGESAFGEPKALREDLQRKIRICRSPNSLAASGLAD